MTRKAATAAPIAQEIVELELDLLRPSPYNPRKTHDPKALEELAASIAQRGVQTPLLVRPIDIGADEDAFEIVAGSRRKAASLLAGKKMGPCIIRAMTDEEAREIAIIDNLQREDTPPLEEAEAFGELLERMLSVSAVAAKVGKEQSYVAKSLKLLNLTPWSRDALRESLITIDHARLLARLAADEQNEGLKWCLDPQAGKKTSVDEVVKERIKRKNPLAVEASGVIERSDADAVEDEEEGDAFDDAFGEDEELDALEESGRRPRWKRAWECESVQRLKEHIESNSGVVLDRAPWPMEEDWLLLDVGSCLDCPKNTKANTPLFGDLDMGAAVCTDGACFRAKVEAFVILQGIDERKRASGASIDLTRVEHEFEPLRVSWKSTTVAPRMLKPGICMCKSSARCNHGEGPALAQTFKAGQWVEATKPCESMRAAVTVDWSDVNSSGYGVSVNKLRKPGEILQVCIAPGCKVHLKSWGKKKGESRNGNDAAVKAKREAAEKAYLESEIPIRLAIYDALIKSSKVTHDKLFRLLILKVLGRGEAALIADHREIKLPNRWDEKPIISAISRASKAELDMWAFDLLAVPELKVNEWNYEPAASKRDREDLWALAREFGVNPDAIAKPFEAKTAPKKTPAKKAAAKKAAPAKKSAKKIPAKKAAKKKAVKK